MVYRHIAGESVQRIHWGWCTDILLERVYRESTGDGVQTEMLLGRVHGQRFHWGQSTGGDFTSDGVQTDSAGVGVQTEIPLGMVYIQIFYIQTEISLGWCTEIPLGIVYRQRFRLGWHTYRYSTYRQRFPLDGVQTEIPLGIVYRQRFRWGWCVDRDSAGGCVQIEIPLGMVYTQRF